MTGRPRSASDEAIFEAIAAVVTASGPSQLTLAAVAGRVGLSAPALAQRFGSKQGLLAAFAAREAVAVAGTLAAARAGGTDPVQAPHAVAHSRALRDGIAALVTDAVQAGLLAADAIPETLAADLWAAYCGAMLTWAIDGTGTLPDWISAHLERILAPHRTYAKQATPAKRTAGLR